MMVIIRTASGLQALKDAGYTSVVHGYNIVNTRTPETVTITGRKTWDDNNDQDGIRLETVTIKLMADEKDTGKAVVLTEDNNWTELFMGIPVYNAGEKIKYTVEEVAVNGYETVYTSSTDGKFIAVTNTHQPETFEIAVTKKWDDNDDQDGIRPEKIAVYLMANGEKVETVTLTAEDEWKYVFEVPKFDAGEEIKYTVSEKPVDGYSYQITGNGTAEVTITNKHTPEEINLDVVEKWIDNSDMKGNRPDSITVQLYANGEKYGDAVKITEKGEWEYTFEDLPKNEDGEAIKYTVKEVGVKYYVAKYTTKDGDLVITNTYTDIPLTGDTLNVILWIMIVFGSGCVLSFIGFRTLRRRSSAK